MALTSAVAVGAVAAVAVPLLARGHDELLGGLLTDGLVRIPLGSLVLGWSWPVFATITLLAWALLAAARNR